MDYNQSSLIHKDVSEFLGNKMQTEVGSKGPRGTVKIDKRELLDAISPKFIDWKLFEDCSKEEIEETIIRQAKDFINGWNSGSGSKFSGYKYKLVDNANSGCFIATATFGNYNSPEVIFLREWRDKILMESIIGRLFIQSYYKVSPFIAPIISKNNNLKKISKFLLIKFIHSLPGLNEFK
jgi:hypothetical protein